jgi:hypothetical protein
MSRDLNPKSPDYEEINHSIATLGDDRKLKITKFEQTAAP